MAGVEGAKGKVTGDEIRKVAGNASSHRTLDLHFAQSEKATGGF